MPRPQVSVSDQGLAALLLQNGVVAGDDLLRALTIQRATGARLADILIRRRMANDLRLYRVLARYWGTEAVDMAANPPDPRLIDRLDLTPCLRATLLPWRRVGDLTIIVASHPDDFLAEKSALTACFGQVALACAPAPRIEAQLLALRGARMNRDALLRVPEAESCRGWGSDRQALLAWLAVLLTGLWAVLAPISLALVLTGWTMGTLVIAIAVKFTATCAALRPPPTEGPPVLIQRLPTVSVMVALYREAGIAQRLVQRLSLLDYPRDLLDILLVVEEEDRLTRNALAAADLPAWMRIVVVPDGKLKTKPRALNHALRACRGSIIGVYDAEDAPDPDQIRKVVERFHNRGAQVACLQGVLDFYNPRTNWLSRCFTMEYATWFRLILPGMARLGFPIPLGGTTLFFRRAALEELGAWDAFNVTEDADLGMRLARHGYRTELIATTTMEEANCRALPWIKQRSRWLKGYMMTYVVHMRQPLLLWRQLGPRQFLGFQCIFVTTLTQFLLAPLLWSFWILPFGLPHPLIGVLPPWAALAISAIFALSEALQFATSWIALRLTPNRMNPLWALMLHFYFPLGSLASYKAAWEMVTRPFWWDKTSHGHFDGSGPA